MKIYVATNPSFVIVISVWKSMVSVRSCDVISGGLVLPQYLKHIIVIQKRNKTKKLCMEIISIRIIICIKLIVLNNIINSFLVIQMIGALISPLCIYNKSLKSKKISNHTWLLCFRHARYNFHKF